MKIITFLCLLFTSLSSFSHEPQFDIDQIKKEIWIQPTFEFNIQLVINRSTRKNFAQGTIKSLSEVDKKNILKLKAIYSDYKVSTYRFSVHEAKINYLNKPEFDLDYFPAMGGWHLTLYLQEFPYNSENDFKEVMSQPETFKFEGLILVNGNFKRFSPKVIYNISVLEI